MSIKPLLNSITFPRIFAAFWLACLFIAVASEIGGPDGFWVGALLMSLWLVFALGITGIIFFAFVLLVDLTEGKR